MAKKYPQAPPVTKYLSHTSYQMRYIAQKNRAQSVLHKIDLNVELHTPPAELYARILQGTFNNNVQVCCAHRTSLCKYWFSAKDKAPKTEACLL